MKINLIYFLFEKGIRMEHNFFLNDRKWNVLEL